MYPNGISGALAEHLGSLPDMEVRTASIDDPEQGVSEAALAETDVLLWFGHVKHGQVKQESVDRVVRHVKERGMGSLPLHSSHYAKPLKQLTGTSGSWRDYVENGKPARILVAIRLTRSPRASKTSPFPRRSGMGSRMTCRRRRRWCSWGCMTTAGRSRETGSHDHRQRPRLLFPARARDVPIYFMGQVRRIIENGVRWCARRV